MCLPPDKNAGLIGERQPNTSSSGEPDVLDKGVYVGKCLIPPKAPKDHLWEYCDSLDGSVWKCR